MKNSYIVQKSYRVILLSAFVVLTVSSCKKQLFEEPYSSLSPASAFETADRIEKAAIGMYDQLQNANYLGGRVLIYADVRGTDVNPSSYFNPLPQFTTVTANDGLTAGAWQGAYRTIGEANLFLKNMAAAGNIVSAAKANQYTGEAKFIRALSYFYLVNLFAQPYKFTANATHFGVPLVLTSSAAPFDSSNQLPRSTVAQVYDQMEADLKDAEAKLPVDYSDPSMANVARATKGAARALLARIYLYKGDYPNAVTYANYIINSGGKYGMNADPLTAFRTFTTKESIFSVAHNTTDNPNTNNALGQHYSPSKRGDINVSNEYVALMDQTKDLRYLNLITTVSSNYWTLKYTLPGDWAPILRYPEMLLIKAEALANQATGVSAEALGLVNDVRARSHADPIVALTKQDLIDKILIERRIELAFEGQGSFDYLRTGRGIPAHGIVTAQAYGSNYTVLPIPFYETSKSPILESQKNPGY